jgi:small conductance mechanosensitive channel
MFYERGCKRFVITKSNVIKKVKEVLLSQGFSLPADIQEVKFYDLQTSIPLEIVSKPTDRIKKDA